jgi:hypothetical protein
VKAEGEILEQSRNAELEEAQSTEGLWKEGEAVGWREDRVDMRRSRKWLKEEAG